MNLMHLKYAVEVARHASVSQAAESLYMNQSNLSRMIKELEESVNLTLFHRSPRGVTLTPEGERFMVYAQNILAQVEEVKALSNQQSREKHRLSIAVPRASYISAAFTQFVKGLGQEQDMEMDFRETNSILAMNQVVQAERGLGIIRYQSHYEEYFHTVFEEKGLKSELLMEFRYHALMSKRHPLAGQATVTPEALAGYIEIAHGDSFVTSMPVADVKKAELPKQQNRQILVYERGSQFDLLSELDTAYMWVSPIPKRMLVRYGLVQRPCESSDKTYRDVLIYRKEHYFNATEKGLLEEIRQTIEKRLPDTKH